MAGETFSSGIAHDISNVIKKREEVFADDRKTADDLQLLHSNTAWIKLRSSVNVGDDSIAEELVAKKYIKQADADKLFNSATSELAEQMVLLSGTRTAFQGGSNPGLRQGVAEGTDYDLTKAYNWDIRTGYRPMGGITSLTVTSKNTYGTLQQAEVSFVLWTLEDLEKASNLYFKPGYSALLEWGHSVYVDTDGNIERTGVNHGTVADEKFFKDGKFVTIENNVNAIRENHSYNYDGLFGFITNFNWSFRADGGYDCSIKIVSKGSVLDSLKTGKASDAASPADNEEEQDKEDLKTAWHAHFAPIEKAYTGLRYNEEKRRVIDGNKAIDDAKVGLKGSNLKKFSAFGFETDIVEGSYALAINEKSINLRYIPLYTVLDIFNNYGTIQEPKTKQSLVKFDIESQNKYLTYDEHFSLDPLPVVLPKVPKGDYTNYSLTRGDLHKSIEQFAGTNSDKIMYLMVSTHLVKGELDKVIDSTEEGLGILDAIKGILAAINSALGGINELDISKVSEDTYTIVDRKKTLFENEASPKPPVLAVTGLSSTILDLSLSSTISNQIAAQVSIAAQGAPGNFSDNVSNLLRWNGATVDRHFKRKETNKDTENNDEAEQREAKFKEKYDEVWKDFNEKDSDYLGATWADCKPGAISLIQRGVRPQFKGGKVPGTIPVELKIKMLGIAGMKIGQSFKIKPGVLPSIYDSFGYLITGLNHEIGSDNKWYTNIKTQFYAV